MVKRSLALVGCLALSACSLGSPGELHVALELAGPTVSQGQFTVVLRSSKVASGHLLIDGRELPDPLARDVARIVTVTGDGLHTLAARVSRSGQSTLSAPIHVTVDTQTPTLIGDPLAQLHVGGPIHSTLRFSEPLAPCTTAGITTEPGPGGVQAPLAVSVRMHGSFLDVVSEPVTLDLEDRSSAHLVVAPCDHAGNSLDVSAGSWTAPTLSVTTANVEGERIRDRFWMYAAWHPNVPVDLLLDGAPVARLEQGGTLVDTRAWPEGQHLLRFDGDGAWPSPQGVTIFVDRTGPRVVSCVSPSVPADDPLVRDGVGVQFDEPVSGVPYGQPGFDLRWYRLHPPPPEPFASVWSVDLVGTTDLLGNPLAGETTCSLPFHAWQAPHDSGPIEVDGVVLRPRVAVLDFFGMLVERDDPDPSARLRPLAWGFALGAWQLTDEDLGSTPSPSGLTSASRSAAWLAQDGSGAVSLRSRCTEFEPSPGLVSLEGVDPAGTVLGASPSDCGFTWCGPSASGLREAWISWRREEQLCSPPYGCGLQRVRHSRRVGDDPARDVLATAFESPWVAFVEDDGTGRGQLRVHRLPEAAGDALEPVGGPLNRDLTLTAEHPAVGPTGVVAWIENGVALARVLGPANTWSDPIVLNLDEASPARWPTVSGQQVIFVERYPDGDHIEIRRHVPDTNVFVRLEDLVPGDDLAAVSATGDPLEVLWQDSAGALRLRRYNE